MKLRGISVARHLDHSRCAFRVVEHEFTRAEIALHDECVENLEGGNASGPLRQIFLRSLLARFKVRTALAEARRALAEGRSVVIAVQHTGDAAARRSRWKNSMLDAMHRLECDAPAALEGVHNAIDEIVLALHDEFGVAEITGRTTRLELVGGAASRVRVPRMRDELDAFQAGRKRVAIDLRRYGDG